MAFHNPASKFERALRAYLIAQGKARSEDTFISADSRSRNVVPNRTIKVTSFNPIRGHRPEGEVRVEIQHTVDAVEQPGDELTEIQRLAMDQFLGDTFDSLSCGDAQSLNRIADAITTAGRALAVSDDSEAGNKQAARNADMVNFRCDWVKQSSPLLTRGHPDGDSIYWMEILNYTAFVSTATVSNEE